MSLVLVAIVLLPALGALFASVGRGARVCAAARTGTLASGLAFLLAVVVMVDVGVGGSLSAVTPAGDGHVAVGLFANRITGVLLLLVCGVSCIVQAFARGYLHGDMRGQALLRVDRLVDGGDTGDSERGDAGRTRRGLDARRGLALPPA